jgi:hypothetical protein
MGPSVEDYREEDRGYETPCHVWLRGKTTNGYAQACRDGKTVRAHRHCFEEVCGEVPEGLELDHLCAQRDCVRIDHTKLVTSAENTHARSGCHSTVQAHDLR